ncbi:MAG: ABC transporter permease, partial [Actinobacteria bacterium]|nr:ABC transporter permease [Actinomycetota bacterium]
MNVVRSALAQGRWELRTIMRNGEQLLVSFGLPALALVALHRGIFALPEPADALGLAGVLAMAVLSSSFTSQAIALGFDRRWGVLRMLSTTPLGPGGLVRGKAIAV